MSDARIEQILLHKSNKMLVKHLFIMFLKPTNYIYWNIGFKSFEIKFVIALALTLMI